jgi:hypothetical protein
MTFSGVFGSTAQPWERWSMRFNFIGAGSGPFSLVELQAGVSALNTHLLPYVNEMARLTEVKSAAITPAGEYAGDPTILAVDVAGGAGSPVHAPQISLAISLATALRGPRGRGRFYLPAPAVPFQTTNGLIPDASRDGVQTAAAAFISALNAATDGGTVVVASSFGTNSPVTGVRVGRVLDTIRSRRRSVPETYDPPTPVTV